jgi:hypothetical protein
MEKEAQENGAATSLSSTTTDLVDRHILPSYATEVEMWKNIAHERMFEIERLRFKEKRYRAALNLAYPLLVTYPGDSAPAVEACRSILIEGSV